MPSKVLKKVLLSRANNERLKYRRGLMITSVFDLIVQVKPHDRFKRQGQNIVLDQKITFSQAALGDTIEIPTIDGIFKLKVRPGTQPGTLIRLQGKGVPHPQLNRRGDQYIRFIIEIPKNLSRRQKELLREF